MLCSSIYFSGRGRGARKGILFTVTGICLERFSVWNHGLGFVVLLLSILECCQPIELILGSFFRFINFPILPPPPELLISLKTQNSSLFRRRLSRSMPVNTRFGRGVADKASLQARRWLNFSIYHRYTLTGISPDLFTLDFPSKIGQDISSHCTSIN